MIGPEPTDKLHTPWVEQTDPIGIVFVHVPSVVPLAWAVMVQVPGLETGLAEVLPGMVAFARLNGLVAEPQKA